MQGCNSEGNQRKIGISMVSTNCSSRHHKYHIMGDVNICKWTTTNYPIYGCQLLRSPALWRGHLHQVTFSSKNVGAAVTGDLAFARAPRLDKGGGWVFFGCQSCWLWLASRPMCCNGQSLHLCPGIQQLCPSNGGKGIGHSRHSKASIGMVCIKWALLPAKCPGITQDLSTPRVWKYLVHWCDRIF